MALDRNKLVKYIALGYSNIEIAEILGYSFSTIKFVVVLMLKEYNVKNRCGLVTAYLQANKNINVEELFEVEG